MRLLRPLLLVWAGAWSSLAPAVTLETEMHIGRRWYHHPLEPSADSGGGGQETTTRLHIRLAPRFSVGLSHLVQEARAVAWGPTAERVRLTGVNLEAKAFHILSSRNSSYLRLRYPIFTDLHGTFREADDLSLTRDLTVKGLELSLGFSHRIAPIVAVVVELGQNFERIERLAGGMAAHRSLMLLGGLQIEIFFK